MKAVSDESTAKDWLDYKWSAVKSDRDGSIASLKKQRSAGEGTAKVVKMRTGKS